MFYPSMHGPNVRQMEAPQAGIQSIPMFPPYPQIGTTLPTGIPLGPSPAGITPTGPTPPTPVPTPMVSVPVTPPSVQNPNFTAGFLRTQIGKNMRVSFLIGTTGPLIDRTGRLVAVGASYILLQPETPGVLVMADLYSIKFVDIFG